MFWIFPGISREFSQKFPGNLPEIFRILSRCFLDFFQKESRIVLQIAWKLSGILSSRMFWEMLRKCSGRSPPDFPKKIKKSRKIPSYSEFFIFSLLIRGAINAVLGDVLGGSGGGFGRCGGMFWEVFGRKKPRTK